MLPCSIKVFLSTYTPSINASSSTEIKPEKKTLTRQPDFVQEKKTVNMRILFNEEEEEEPFNLNMWKTSRFDSEKILNNEIDVFWVQE